MLELAERIRKGNQDMQNKIEKIIIPFIIGDGIGNDIWKATKPILDQAMQTAYDGQRAIEWKEVLAGQKAYRKTGNYLPQESIDTLKQYKVAIKGPLTTPVGGGYTSLNVALRKELDLYSCIRPVQWFPGLPSPLKNPADVNVVVFRENTEDLYAGIEFPSDSEGNQQLLDFLKKRHPEEYARLRYTEQVGLDIKPISRNATQRIMKAALQWTIAHQLHKVTIVHKGNIMKYTEGAFRNWAYDVAEQKFGKLCFSKRTWQTLMKEQGKGKANEMKEQALAGGSIYVDDLIADNAFAKAIANPADFEVIVTANLNGDYLSDAFAALVGGIGISAGANINQEKGWGLFEANHGSADDIANQDIANPSSLILSAAMMFDFMGWEKAARLIRHALEQTIQAGFMTADLHAQSTGSNLVSTSDFSKKIIEFIQ